MITRLLKLFWNYPMNPADMLVILKDVLKKRHPCYDNKRHVKEALNWICFAQDVSPDGGVSAGYSIIYGWQPSHRETTGYIIPTFFHYYGISGNEEFSNRAIRMAEWELSIQLDNGAIPFGADAGNRKPLVFDTGQVIFGWVRVYKETGESRYKDAAERAGGWLVDVQDEDGCWRRFTFNRIPHAYNVRVAWALLELFRITEKEQYANAAKKNIEWTLSQQQSNGWLNQCAFRRKDLPTTHTMAYSIRGILESGLILGEQEYVEKAKKTADVLLSAQNEDGSLSGIYDSGWNAAVKWSCLTGNAQISIIWLRLYEIIGDSKYLEAAKRANAFLKGLQVIQTRNKNIRGAIKGSHPIWGGYNPFNYMNWMTKFFADSLILEEKIRNSKINSSIQKKPTESI